MITLKLTSIGGNTKAYQFPTAEYVRMFIAELENALPANVGVQISCDLLGISGFLKGNK